MLKFVAQQHIFKLNVMNMKQLFKSRFLISIGYLLSVHALALLVFGLFRWVLFVATPYDMPQDIAGDYPLQMVAFVRGLWFDNVIACYVLTLPLVLCWVAGWMDSARKWVYRTCSVWFVVLYALCFGFTAANIPYFAYFFKVINSSIFGWFSYAGTTAGMVVGERSWYFPIFLGVLSIVLFALAVLFLERFFFKKAQTCPREVTCKKVVFNVLAGAALCGACVFGIRGRMGYNPIKVSAAYYCTDAFLNQLGVNPVFNIMTSVIDDNRKENKRLHLMDDEQAVKQAQQYLNRQGVEGISPLARRVTDESGPSCKNVVMVFMESMSAHLMGAFGNKEGLTPHLDSIYAHALSFNNFYSSGIHTNHGLYSTLYSFPAIMKRNAMKGSVIPVYSGLPTVLKENGYHNMFFMTHESQYDNMNAFFRTNGFDDIYAQENYPKDKVVNGFGVQDDFLFSYALPVMRKQAATGEPFFAALLTISNHPPYVIPASFHARSSQPEQQIVEFADEAIGQFMAAAKKEPWYDNTIFVFLGDHGKLVGTPECESPQSYNHIPFMIYGKGIESKTSSRWAGQVDVAPTLLSMLGINYVQNNFGVNLLKEQRPYMYFTADNLVGTRDSTHLYLYIPETGQEMHYDVKPDGSVQTASDKAPFKAMKEYCFSMLQAAEVLVERGETINDEPEKK